MGHNGVVGQNGVQPLFFTDGVQSVGISHNYVSIVLPITTQRLAAIVAVFVYD